MTDSQKFDIIMKKLEKIDHLEIDMRDMKNDMQDMKNDMQGMKGDIQKLDQRVTGLQLHVENVTDRNIQLLAENFIELTKKLNKAIPAADKNLAYEVKVNYLVEEVQKLKEDVAELKGQTA